MQRTIISTNQPNPFRTPEELQDAREQGNEYIMIDGREYVITEDVCSILVYHVEHRDEPTLEFGKTRHTTKWVPVHGEKRAEILLHKNMADMLKTYHANRGAF